jgi:hypothetical protein
MRTTLDLDEDVLQSAKEIALFRGSTAGQVISELVRKALQGAGPSSPREERRTAAVSTRARIATGDDEGRERLAERGMSAGRQDRRQAAPRERTS